MGHGFENVGIMELSKGKRSLKITLNELPFTSFSHIFYVSVKNVEEVIKGHKKNVTIVMRTGDRDNESAEAHKS